MEENEEGNLKEDVFQSEVMFERSPIQRFQFLFFSFFFWKENEVQI
jgi:hypothetical protein